MLELIERLEKATGPDRELDAVIWLAVTPGATRRSSTVKSSKGLWPDYTIDETRDANGILVIVPAFTASLDAALTLVPEGWSWKLLHEPAHPNLFRVVIRRADELAKVAPAFVVSCPTPALALACAALRARLAVTKGCDHG